MRVLVTRPEPGASATASRLRDLGHEPILLPLSQIGPLAPANLPEPAAIDAVVLTSANAVAHAPDGQAARYGRLPCFAVGERTADAARATGFSRVSSADGDVHALVELVAANLPAGARLLYLCGRLRRPVLEVELGKRGYVITAVETYRVDPVDHALSDVGAILADRPVDAVLVYSRFGAERLSALLLRQGDASRLGKMRILCMSRQVADGLPDNMRARAEIADSPDEDALLALLGRAR